MKYIAVLLFLLSAPCTSFAQKGSIAKQKACYEQAQKYVQAKNREGNVSFVRAHHQSETNTCFVEYMVYVSCKDCDPNEPIWIALYVDDAFEGNGVAECLTKNLVPTSDCSVLTRKARTFDSWDDLLHNQFGFSK